MFGISFSCFAGIWIETKPALANVNLANPDNLYNGTEGEYKGYNTISKSEHCENEMIGVIGISSDSVGTKYKITFEFVGGKRWMFSSLDDANYAIPFGIDFVSRKRYLNGSDDNYEISGLGHVIHAGYQGGNSPESDYGGDILLEVTNDLQGVWLDMVLVIPDRMDIGFWGSSGNYQATLIVHVENISTGEESSFPFVLTGYYNVDTVPEKATVYFSVIPNGRGITLNLSETKLDDIIIGRYIYSTETEEKYNITKPDSKYSVFVSSSESPFSPGETFTLELNREYDKESAEAEGLLTSIQFQVGLKSNFQTDVVVWFDGDETIYNLENNQILNSQVIFLQTINNHEEKNWWGFSTSYPIFSQSFLDDGEIVFRLKNKNIDVGRVAEGRYSETIYIHLVSNY